MGSGGVATNFREDRHLLLWTVELSTKMQSKIQQRQKQEVQQRKRKEQGQQRQGIWLRVHRRQERFDKACHTKERPTKEDTQAKETASPQAKEREPQHKDATDVVSKAT